MVMDARNTDSERQPLPFSILVADDDRGIRETLADILAAQGFRPVLAADGAEAVEIVQVEMIHLVVFDMHMPRLTGLEALELVRRMNALLPAILMTADATKDLMRQAFEAHVYSVLPKPVSKAVMLNTMFRALTRVYGPPAQQSAPPTPQPPAGDAPPAG